MAALSKKILPSISSFASRLLGSEIPTVWHEFTPLAQQTGAVNLGQGFPDWSPPEFVRNALKEATEGSFNQYTRSGGHMSLVKVIAEQYSKKFARPIDPLHQVTISVGATEGIFAALQSFIEPGDEVVLMEPAFDIYSAQTKMAGGVCKYVPLRPVHGEDGVEWVLDYDEFEALFSSKTRALLLNTPHNPTGKVFKHHELEKIASIVKKYPNVIVLSDEVYEHLVYGKATHVPFATLPSMFDRTITISSAGKTLSVTGWKIGWLVGPKELIYPVMLTNQWVQFSVATVLQEAVARSLVHAEEPYEGHPSFYAYIQKTFEAKRDKLVKALREAGLNPHVPEAGYFVIADTDKYRVPDKYMSEGTPSCPVMRPDWAFCRMLCLEHGVVAIPPSAFYAEEHQHLASKMARFAFCKTDETLDRAVENFKKLALSDKRIL